MGRYGYGGGVCGGDSTHGATHSRSFLSPIKIISASLIYAGQSVVEWCMAGDTEVLWTYTAGIHGFSLTAPKGGGGYARN